MRSVAVFAILLSISQLEVEALSFPFQARTRRADTVLRRGLLRGRADVTGQSVNTFNGSVPIRNTQNAEYISNITLNGVSVPVMLDTGSSDLWVTGDIPSAQDSGKSASLDYAVGKASGDINFATLTFDNYTVDKQAFLLVKDTSTFSTNIAAQGFQGLVGLGPNSGSVISHTIGDSSGDAMLDRIFQQNKTSANYITFLLDRANDPGDSVTGQITVSELVAGMEKITSQPKLEVEKVPGLTDRDQHWQILTDVDGVIGPDGQPIKTKSIVPKAPSGKLVAVLDSGFTLPQVPRKMSDAIYGRVQGANWDDHNQVWTIPCTQMLNISFKFGGQTFPVHPLDVSSSDFGLTDSSGTPVCAGAFQPISSAFSLLGEYDMILGMGFLRNAYTLLDFGNFVDAGSNDRGDPYVQMLSITDVNEGHSDFVKVRLNSIDSTGDPSQALLPASQGKSSPESAAEKKAHLEEKVLSRWPYILLGGLALLALSVGCCIWRCCCRRKRVAAKKANKAVPMGSLGLGSGGYRQLNNSGALSPTPGHHPPFDQAGYRESHH